MNLFVRALATTPLQPSQPYEDFEFQILRFFRNTRRLIGRKNTVRRRISFDFTLCLAHPNCNTIINPIILSPVSLRVTAL